MLTRSDKQTLLPLLSILFFDRYNAGDPLFVADVARRLVASAKSGRRALILHSSHEAVERALEAVSLAQGDSAVGERDLVERAVRLANQSITRRLIDEGVPAVSVQGSDRGLLRVSSNQTVSTGNIEWLERAIGMGGVPVVSLLAQNRDQLVEVTDEAAALDAVTDSLSDNWEVTNIFFTTNRKSTLFEPEGTRIDRLDWSRVSAFEELPLPVRSGNVCGKAAAVVVTNSAGLAPDGSVAGTHIVVRG